ncbi:replicative DNA helicase [Kitasatospora sp. NPDC048545]|uniref:replicative DNA helicase n=1 Tax=Kitasatospora sp. NPDC048545 TaxID=3157208 RepID=UPI0033E5D0E2
MTMYLVEPQPEDYEPEPEPESDVIPAGGPSNLQAEQATVGGMMFDRDKVGEVCSVLKPRDYQRPAHEEIHKAIVRLFSRGEPTDPIAVTAELARTGDLQRVGGAPYLHALMETARTALDAAYCASIVHEQAVLRRLVKAGMRITDMGRAAEGNVREIVDAAQKELFEVADEHAEEDMLAVADTMGGHLDDVEARKANQGKLVGVPTGYADLDALTGGLRGGQMIVVAARPAMGKSTLALDFARSAAIQHGLPTVIFSLEMSRGEIHDRLLSAEAKVLLERVRSGNLTDDDWTRIARRMPAITAAPLYIDASAQLTGMDIRTKARRLAQKHPLGLVVIDYLQLMQSGGGKAENRQLEVSEISRGAKTLAKELNVPVVALSQLNRGPEQRQDKKPVVSDLRESGSIEQDADMVILLHREDAYEKESPRAGEADLIVGKHRNGPTATITVASQLHYSRFTDLAREQ